MPSIEYDAIDHFGNKAERERDKKEDKSRCPVISPPKFHGHVPSACFPGRAPFTI